MGKRKAEKCPGCGNPKEDKTVAACTPCREFATYVMRDFHMDFKQVMETRRLFGSEARAYEWISETIARRRPLMQVMKVPDWFCDSCGKGQPDTVMKARLVNEDDSSDVMYFCPSCVEEITEETNSLPVCDECGETYTHEPVCDPRNGNEICTDCADELAVQTQSISFGSPVPIWNKEDGRAVTAPLSKEDYQRLEYDVEPAGIVSDMTGELRDMDMERFFDQMLEAALIGKDVDWARYWHVTKLKNGRGNLL